MLYLIEDQPEHFPERRTTFIDIKALRALEF